MENSKKPRKQINRNKNNRDRSVQISFTKDEYDRICTVNTDGYSISSFLADIIMKEVEKLENTNT